MSQVNRLCTRDVDFQPSDPAAASNSDGRTLEGYAAVFGAPARINSWEGNFEERIAPGAFKKTLSERKPVVQFDHGKDPRTGTVPIASIQEIREDDKGLYVRARMFDNPVVEPIRQAIADQAISGMSFRFNVVRDEWRDASGQMLRPEELARLLHDSGSRGPLQRTLKEVQLFEAGPVVTPAYPQTSVGVRSLTDEERQALVEEYRRTMEVEEAKPAETILQEAGYTSEQVTESALRGEHGPETVAFQASEDDELRELAEDVAADEERKTPAPEPADAPAGYADAQKHLPIGTAAECQDSWARLHHDKKLEDSYVSHERAVIKTRIKAAAEKLGIKLHKDPLPESWKNFNGGKYEKSAEVEAEERDERTMSMGDGASGGDAVPAGGENPEKKKHTLIDGMCTVCGY